MSRLGETHFRLTSAEPALAWLQKFAWGHDVTIEDASHALGALASNAREILNRTSDADLDALKFFAVTPAKIAGVAGHISPTGYTGDLGYEGWVAREHALAAWDGIMTAGKPYRIEPVRLDAMDVSPMEAGFIMNGVDYFSANHCLIESRKSSPYEIGLGWTVQLDREPFVGQAALRAERAREPVWARVGLVYDWDEYEALFAEFGLPPGVPAAAWRDPHPVYDEAGRQVGTPH